MLAMLKPEKMDERLAMDSLDELEFTARQLEQDPTQEGSEKQQEIAELIGRVKNRLAQCLKRRQKANYRSLCKSNLSQVWQLIKLVDIHPSLVLHEPDDFILYWYIHGGFPCDMSLWDMEQTRRKLESQLNRLSCRGESDSAYASYRREKIETQLQQLQDMREQSFQKACGAETSADIEDSHIWQEEGEEEAFESPDDEGEEGLEDSEVGPVYLAFLPEEPEHPEDMTILELAWEIEKQEYTLFELKSVEHGEEGTEKPFLWQESVDSISASLTNLRELLRQRLLEALGVEAEDPSVPEEFQDGDLPILLSGDELERPEDIVASWYLSDSFPLIVSGEKLLLVEAELKRQQAKLEAEEPEDEAEHAVWQFLWEQRAEQLEQIQTMMRNQADQWEFVDLEEEPVDEW